MSDTFLSLFIALLLLAANAFYVASEFALVKSRGFRVDAMAENGNCFGARLLKQMMGNIEAYLACCQLGITMASLGLGWVGEPTVSALLRRFWRPWRCRTACISRRSWSASWCSPRAHCLGEQVPKTLAIREPDRSSQWLPIRSSSPFFCFIR